MSRLLIEAQKIIQINSQSHFGNEDIVNYLISLFQEAGIEHKIQHVTHSNEDISKRQFNILGIIGDPLVDRKTKKGLMLLSHLDTVGPGEKNRSVETQKSPLSSEIKNEYLYGLGAATKIDFLCKLFAAKKMKEHKLRMPIYIVGVCGNNIGMLGARYLVQSNALNPRFVYVQHPTSDSLGCSHGASASFSIQIGFQTMEKDARGFNRGLNLFFIGKQGRIEDKNKFHAIENMLNLLNLSVEKGFELRFKSFVGGEYEHINPDHAFAELYLSSHQYEDFKRFLREKEKSNEGELSQGLKVEFGVLGESGVSFLPSQLLQCVQKIKKEIDQFLEEFKAENKNLKINLGKIIQKNNKLELIFSVFYLDGFKSIEDRFKDIVKNSSEQYPRLNLNLQVHKKIPNFKIKDDSFLLNLSKKILESQSKSVECIHSDEPSSAGIFNEAGYDVSFFGSSDLKDNLFAPDEKISIEKIQFAYEYYLKLIERICL